MRVMTNLSHLKQDLNVNSHVFEEVSMFTYLNALTTRKNYVIMVCNVLSSLELHTRQHHTLLEGTTHKQGAKLDCRHNTTMSLRTEIQAAPIKHLKKRIQI
jgi:hypothetical protein